MTRCRDCGGTLDLVLLRLGLRLHANCGYADDWKLLGMTTQITCDYCKQPVQWARTDRENRPMPLDLGTSLAGNVAASWRNGRLIARVLRKGEAPRKGEEQRMPHWATCPKPPERRGR